MPGVDDVPITSPTRSMLALDSRARAPGRRRRQLHRARVRADVPALRRRGHGRREGAAADRARGRGRLGGDPGDPRRRGHRGAHRRRVHRLRAARRGRGRRRRLHDGRARRSSARTCCSPSGAGPNTDDLGLDARRRRDRRARLHHRRRRAAPPTCPASGRSATATAAAPSRTPPTTTSRSSPPTCSTASSRRVSDRIPAYALYIDPPLGRVGMTEAEARATGRPLLDRQAPDDAGRPRDREGRDAGLHEGRRRRRDAADPRRRDPRARAATRRSTASST